MLRVLEICKQENDLFLAVMLGVSRDWWGKGRAGGGGHSRKRGEHQLGRGLLLGAI